MTRPHNNHQPCEHVDAHLIHELVEALAGLHLEAAQHRLWHSHLAGLDPRLFSDLNIVTLCGCLLLLFCRSCYSRPALSKYERRLVVLPGPTFAAATLPALGEVDH